MGNPDLGRAPPDDPSLKPPVLPGAIWWKVYRLRFRGEKLTRNQVLATMERCRLEFRLRSARLTGPYDIGYGTLYEAKLIRMLGNGCMLLNGEEHIRANQWVPQGWWCVPCRD